METEQHSTIETKKQPTDRRLTVQAEVIRALGLATDEHIMEYMLSYAPQVRVLLDTDQEVKKLLTDNKLDDKKIAQLIVKRLKNN